MNNKSNNYGLPGNKWGTRTQKPKEDKNKK